MPAEDLGGIYIKETANWAVNLHVKYCKFVHWLVTTHRNIMAAMLVGFSKSVYISLTLDYPKKKVGSLYLSHLYLEPILLAPQNSAIPSVF